MLGGRKGGNKEFSPIIVGTVGLQGRAAERTKMHPIRVMSVPFAASCSALVVHNNLQDNGVDLLTVGTPSLSQGGTPQ